MVSLGLAVLVFAAVPRVASPSAPRTPAPPPPQPGAPPPAWIESQTRSAWLFFDSYCWKTSCVEMIPPETRPGLPVFTVARGETVRVHLGFVPTSATVSIDNGKIPARLDAKKRIVSWAVARAGIVRVAARAAGSATYTARLRIR
jgi:hypothetical protein